MEIKIVASNPPSKALKVLRSSQFNLRFWSIHETNWYLVYWVLSLVVLHLLD